MTPIPADSEREAFDAWLATLPRDTPSATSPYDLALKAFVEGRSRAAPVAGEPMAWREWQDKFNEYIYREKREHLPHPDLGEPLYAAPPETDLLSEDEALSFMGFESQGPPTHALLPPDKHPLRVLGAMLGDYLDDDKFKNCESLILSAWGEISTLRGKP